MSWSAPSAATIPAHASAHYQQRRDPRVGPEHGQPVGERGRLSKTLVQEYCTWQEMPLLLRIERLQQRVAELSAEGARKDEEIARLQRQVDGLMDQVQQWKDVAATLAMAEYAED